MKISEILECLDKREIRYEVVKQSSEVIDVAGFSSLFQYKDNTVTFIVPERHFSDFSEQYRNRDISFIILGRSEEVYDCFLNAIRVGDPRKAFFAILEDCFSPSDDENVTGISSNPEVYRKNSFISESAVIGENVKIGVGCVIEGDVVIGDNTEIHHRVVIRNKTKIGCNCTIHSGVVIGEYGFGYTVNSNNEKTMIRHYGGVTIEDNVHIGDNSVIIRGAIDDTLIKRGVKINTLAHIAHNDVIGENTLITSPVHVCGSVTVGPNCHIAGATIRNQCSVGEGAVVGLGAVVVKDIPEKTTVVGNPARPLKK